MSLYRQAGGFSSRALVAALLAGALAGGLVGFFAGRGSVSEPSAAEVVDDAREALVQVELGIEQVPIEYEGALGPDGRIAAQTEYEAAQDTATRTGAALAETAEDMRAIDPAGYAAAKQAVARLAAAVDAVVPPARVEALAQAAQSQIDALAGV